MTNLFYLMAGINNLSDICQENAVHNILYLVGLVVAIIKITVPILLIGVGMVDLLKAMSSQDDKEIKTATKSLVKKAVVGVVIFLIPSIVGLLMGVIGNFADGDYHECTKCITGVFANKCSWKQ